MLRSSSSWLLAATLLLALPGCYLSDDYSSGRGAAGQGGASGASPAGGNGGASGSAGRGGSAGSAATAGKAGAGGGAGGKAGSPGGAGGGSAGAGGTLSYAASCAAIVDCAPKDEGQLEQQCLAGEKCNQQLFAPEATKLILECLAKRSCNQSLESCFGSFSATSDAIKSARDNFVQSCAQRAKACEAAAETFDLKLCAIPPVFRAEIFLKMENLVGGTSCGEGATFLQDFLAKYAPECGAFGSDFWFAHLGI